MAGGSPPRDIAGLGFAKKCVEEAVVWPLLRPSRTMAGRLNLARWLVGGMGWVCCNVSGSTVDSSWFHERYDEFTFLRMSVLYRCKAKKYTILQDIRCR